MTTKSEKPDDIISDLHKIREQIVESFQGDLGALTSDADKRARSSGRVIIDRLPIRGDEHSKSQNV
jgi:hypothetical protein